MTNREWVHAYYSREAQEKRKMEQNSKTAELSNSAKRALVGGAAGTVIAGGILGARHLYNKHKSREEAKEAGFRDRLKEASKSDAMKYVPLDQAKAFARSARNAGFGVGGGIGGALGLAAGVRTQAHKEKAKKAAWDVPSHAHPFARADRAQSALEAGISATKAGIAASGARARNAKTVLAGAAGGLALGGGLGVAKHLYDKHRTRELAREITKEQTKKAGLGVLGHKVIGASMGAAKSLGQGENLAKVLRKGTELSGGTRQLARNIGIGTVGAGVAGAGALGLAAGAAARGR